MKILIGTTNPSKVNRFKSFFDGYDVEFCTLTDLGISAEPPETGANPLENAKLKAKFYGRYCDYVICNDSGLYFKEMPIDDVRQPGLHIRSPKGVERFDDEQCINYYSNLVKSLGGRVAAYYLDGLAVYAMGKVYGFMDEQFCQTIGSFIMVDEVSEKRHVGWPLDSISQNAVTGKYFVDVGNDNYDGNAENVIKGQYRQEIVEFLARSLSLTKG